MEDIYTEDHSICTKDANKIASIFRKLNWETHYLSNEFITENGIKIKRYSENHLEMSGENKIRLTKLKSQLESTFDIKIDPKTY